MSGKLDQSLDQIMQDSGSTGRKRGGRSNRRAAQKAKAAIAAPTGGVQKNTKTTKTTKIVPKQPAMATQKRPGPTGESKIIMSNIPLDATENDVKDFMRKFNIPARRVMATYGPDGRSRGIFTVIFGDTAAGAKAVGLIDGTPLEGKKIKVEHVLGGSAVPAPAPPKSLSERIGKPKNAAKENNAAPKGKAAAATTTTTNGAGQGKAARGKKAGRAGKPKKKTADELDAEMTDYFGGSEGGAANGTAQPAAATNGAEPVDEVM